MVEAVTGTMAIQTYGAEVGMDGIGGPIELRADASAARSFAMRRGLGRHRHIDTRHVWLQEEVSAGRVRITKIKGDSNPSELMTKLLAAADILYKAYLLNVMVVVRVSADARMGRGRGGGVEVRRPNP